MTDENPTDLQPGDRIEVREFFSGGDVMIRSLEYEGPAVVENVARPFFLARTEGCNTRIALDPIYDSWRRLPAKPEVTTLGELEVGDCFVFIDRVDRAFAANYFDLDKPLRRGCVRQDLGSIWVTQDGTHEKCSMAGGDRVCRVPPPQTSAGSGDAATRKDAGVAPSGSTYASSPQPAVSSPERRWPGADPSWIPALEAKLAEQLKSGGYDCDAQRRLMVRAEKLRREEASRGRVYVSNSGSRVEILAAGIASLNIPKPLIAYKRGR